MASLAHQGAAMPSSCRVADVAFCAVVVVLEEPFDRRQHCKVSRMMQQVDFLLEVEAIVPDDGVGLVKGKHSDTAVRESFSERWKVVNSHFPVFKAEFLQQSLGVEPLWSSCISEGLVGVRLGSADGQFVCKDKTACQAHLIVLTADLYHASFVLQFVEDHPGDIMLRGS